MAACETGFTVATGAEPGTGVDAGRNAHVELGVARDAAFT
ncbi:MAG: hypothetical protein RLZZ20_2653, partial [Pseudomonadota bacterium]